MSHRLYRLLWKLVAPTTLAICSMLAASGVANVVSETILPETAISLPANAPPGPLSASIERIKDSGPLVTRNMFCSECVDEEPIVKSSGASSVRTQLPLRLIATNISIRESQSFASVLNTQSMRQGAYRMGELIPDAGVVHTIGATYLEFRAEGASRVERVQFDTGAAKATSMESARSAASQGGGALAGEFVRAISDTQFEVDREIIGKVRGNPRLAGARARPVHRNGAMVGVRLSAVRSAGLAHSLGLRSGDTVLAANGVKLTSIEAGLELMGQLGRRDHWTFEIERRGKPVKLLIDLQ